MPLPSPPSSRDESIVPPNTIDYTQTNKLWTIPFANAVRNLARFHLVIPLEVVWTDPQPLTDVLGWTNLKEVHVVPSGKVRDNDALSKLPKEQYRVLWDANRLDIILHAWSKAVYMARIHCGGHGWGLD